ncbi:F-box only protein 28 [Eumeta japonica]|uniref:F-box only protein 28 n=1 Tax=Eumeta variegata TaxID=151549 RepID=A0A4C1XIY4_EUMVA|nr:F-box only protein 28 [Eumeta japonica]
MVSTRQMSGVGSNNGNNEGAGPSHGEPVSMPRVTRHSSSLLPGSTSPQQHSNSSASNNSTALVPVQSSRQSVVTILDLPIEVFDKIFRYIGYKAVSELRAILDEVYTVLVYLRSTNKLARPYKVTDELFDLTTMAMEYFKEHIEPNLPEITYFGTDFFDITSAFSPGDSSKSYMCLDSPPPGGFETSAQPAGGGTGNERRVSALNYLMEESLPPSPPPPQSNMVLRKRIHRIKQGMKKYNDQLSALRSDLRSCKRKTALQQKQIAEQQKQIAEQQKQTMDYTTRLDDYDKKNEETSRKFQTLLQELNKCKTELQYWRSRSPAMPPLCVECGAALAVSPLAPPPQHALLQWPGDTNAESTETETASGSSDSSVATAAAHATGETGKPETKVEGGGEKASATPPARRRPSGDLPAPSATPERKKRRLTRPRKL